MDADFTTFVDEYILASGLEEEACTEDPRVGSICQ